MNEGMLELGFALCMNHRARGECNSQCHEGRVDVQSDNMPGLVWVHVVAVIVEASINAKIDS